eukprot:1161095-Pelagomonas_calceolata.AAC.3
MTGLEFLLHSPLVNRPGEAGTAGASPRSQQAACASRNAGCAKGEGKAISHRCVAARHSQAKKETG